MITKALMISYQLVLGKARSLAFFTPKLQTFSCLMKLVYVVGNLQIDIILSYSGKIMYAFDLIFWVGKEKCDV